MSSPRGLTPPAIYDCESEQTTLLVPDPEVRRIWLSILAGAASGLLRASLPAATADNQAAHRPTLLPLPGELPPQQIATVRLKRLARFGAEICSQPPVRGDDDQPVAGSAETEARLFFDYLHDDYIAAGADLDKLDSFITSPNDRLSLLSLRAQVLMARGERAEAQAVIAYLLATGYPDRWIVEETPLGLTYSHDVSPQRAWVSYLSARTAESKDAATSPTTDDPPPDLVEPGQQDLLHIPEVPILERGAGPVTFAPAP
jgi:hypothetical protein